MEGGVELRMIVPMEVRPDGGIGIEILSSVDIPQDRALARHDDHGLAPQPVPHLREGMPDVCVIEASE